CPTVPSPFRERVRERALFDWTPAPEPFASKLAPTKRNPPMTFLQAKKDPAMSRVETVISLMRR
ncbi:hypothetical protein, partial [uncultured Pseudomonas sp.]|uniref:hypothetical protein n=1 Tax=uncultured Pseudomonas sp. TaxID=114707 RepID=UPI0027D99C98